MRRLGWFLLALAACKSDPKDYMVGGGGGGGGGGGVDAPKVLDAAKDAVLAIDANLLSGRVCLVNDASQLTDPSKCSTTGAGGLTVRLGTQSTTTAADGAFTITNDPAAQPIWRVTGTGIASSYSPLGNYYVPALSTTGYDAFRTAATPTEVQGQGSIIALQFKNGAGVAGVTTTSAPTSLNEPYYSSGWAQGTGTDAAGVTWIDGINVGTAAITSTLATTAINTGGIPVYDGGLTFVQVIFP